MGNEKLDQVLNLEKIGNGLYRSTYQVMNTGGRTIFGGQVIALGLLAAIETVSTDYHLHSLHCYFLNAGKDQPIIYKVESTRGGNTYCSRGVKAIQNGQNIFTMQCSFKKAEKDPFQFQVKMPNVPKPHELKNKSEILNELLDLKQHSSGENIISHLQYLKQSDAKSLFAFKPIDQDCYSTERKYSPQNTVWCRLKEPIGNKQLCHKVVAAYVSDMLMLNAASRPGFHLGKHKFFMTTLDHSMWFHKPINVNDWLLFEIESPVTGEGRGFICCRVWSEDGSLVINATQEGVIRTLKSNL
ncbi:hypothetical protein LOTGIDRAFT_149477 [Lottia gigantea]|uniref:Acyl-CoA thioesterase 8 n=1 Tax=Lottia gigantea TaxID=225164 RepID=V3YXH3_LOTGI|nr:hypothetical protein LOTGIDRAFT_149477 [Lottia gigantea]ESO82778.1 hypothetical protein LOTGIDRAFT_149477 [Lottia gigantea]